jgi:protein-disulfide isomerase
LIGRFDLDLTMLTLEEIVQVTQVLDRCGGFPLKRLCLPVLLFSMSLIASSQTKKPASAIPDCPVLDSKTSESVTEYVTAKYHIISVSQLSLKDSGQANADCYWKFEYEILSSRQNITLYLTPDRKYLVPAIYDRSSDPLAEERQLREESIRVLAMGHAASEGSRTGSVTIVEFSDFECPYCQKLTTILEKEVLPDDPDIRVVFRNFPLPMHPWAQAAAQIAGCAELQNDKAFWKMHDYIFQNQHDLTTANINPRLMALADSQPELNRDAFRACVDEGLSMGPVSKDVELGKRFDVHATPTFFINGIKVEGIRDSVQLKRLIAQARSGQLIPTTDVPQHIASAQTLPASNGVACPPAN